jgi:hypothetical protein
MKKTASLNPRFAATVAAIVLVLFGALDIALALGVAWGHFAFTGSHADLTHDERIVIAITGLLHFPAAAALLGRVGLWGEDVPYGVFSVGTGIVIAYLALNVLSIFDIHGWKRFLVTVIALGTAALCVVVAKGPNPRESLARESV